MRILVLCTYPICNPAHGGQLRVRNIVDSYRSAGYSVRVAGILGSEQYEKEQGFLPFPGTLKLAKYISNPFLMEDFAISELAVNDDEIYRKLTSLILETPDVIHVEQPWLFPFALRYRSERCPSVRLLYGSQNIECRLKLDIVRSYLGEKSAEECFELVRKKEIFAIENADGISCVSRADLDWTRKYGNVPAILAPNGVKPWKTTKKGINEARKIVRGKYALYCASGHPPNVAGFFSMLSNGFGSLKPDERLIIAGGAGWAIAGDERVHRSAKLAEKVGVAGVVSQECLGGLLDEAQCVILPLTQGGGTNLKTAEALWAGKYIVATSVAMRGFEKFIGKSGVFLADDSGAFKRALRAAMSLPALELNIDERHERRSLLWEACLEPLHGLLKFITSKVEV